MEGDWRIDIPTQECGMVGLSVHASPWYAELRLNTLAYLPHTGQGINLSVGKGRKQRYRHDVLKLSPSLKRGDYKRIEPFAQIFSTLKNPS